MYQSTAALHLHLPFMNNVWYLLQDNDPKMTRRTEDAKDWEDSFYHLKAEYDALKAEYNQKENHNKQ